MMTARPDEIVTKLVQMEAAIKRVNGLAPEALIFAKKGGKGGEGGKGPKKDKGENNRKDISKKHFRPGGMAPSEWTRSVRTVSDTPVADYSAPGVNTMRRIAHCPPIAVSPFLPQTLQEHSQMLLKAPAVMEVHSGRYEI